jgi:hypothetical protein
LISRNPKPVTPQELLEAIPAATREVLGINLLALRKRRIIQEEKGENGQVRYTLKRPVAEFTARELGDVSQHVKRAVRVIFREVLPRLEQREESCHLTTVSASVPSMVARDMARELHQTILKRSAEYTAEEGDTSIYVVFGVAVGRESG